MKPGYPVAPAQRAGWPPNSTTSPLRGRFIPSALRRVWSQKYTIAASAGDNGSISPTGNVVVSAGADQSFVFDPDAGYEVLNVVIDGTSYGSPSSYSFTDVNGNHTITVTFGAVGSYKIFTAAGSNGSISPIGPVSVAPGGNVNFAIIPNPAYAVDDVQINGSSIGAVTTYTFTAVNSDQTIAAQFILVGDSTRAGQLPGCCRYSAGCPLQKRRAQYHDGAGRLRKHGLGLYDVR